MTNPSPTYDVAIIGAGVIGITTAEALVAAGLSVIIIERHDQAACETSYANGALITPSMAEPWATPGLPLKMLHWIGKEDAPFLLRLSALPRMLSWGWAFVKNCTQAKWSANAKRMVTLSQYSTEHLHQVLKKHKLEHLMSTRGSLRVFRDEISANSAASGIKFMRRHGIKCVEMGAEDCVAFEPALAHMQDDIHSAYHYPNDLSGDCCAVTRALAANLQNTGVKFEYGTVVKGLQKAEQGWHIQTSHNAITAQNIVFATGMPPTSLLSQKSKRHLLCYPVKGYSLTLNIPRTNEALMTPVIDDANKIGVVRLGNKIRIVGMAEFCGANTDVTPTRITSLLDNAKSVLPNWADYAEDNRWAGLRPMSADGVPYIGALDEKGLYVNLGHGHLGWTNACGAAALLRDIIIKASPGIPAHDYAPRLH